MKSFGEIYSTLRRNNRKNYSLIISCIFISVLLTTAYASMMRSPTVLSILPEGGDSRKQVMMIFALSVVGCGVLTTYAAALFFRYKSREAGIFMALGASRRQIRSLMFRELTVIVLGSCAAGALLGSPLAWIIWQFFKISIVNTQEMSLSFDPKAYVFAGAFSLYAIISLFLMGIHFLHRTNIIDIVNEQRKSEPIHDVKPWFGPVGVALIIIGGFGGYMTSGVFKQLFHMYAPSWANITYIPLLIGLYMVLLHTVVRGWGLHKNRYKNIITHSMMKFQGRQTVRNMLVITVLIAGAYFAAFYVPMLGTTGIKETERRPVDYAFHYRADQDMLTRSEIEKIASEYSVNIINWQEADFANLAYDGDIQVDDEGGRYHYEYRELKGEGNYISESTYNKLTGQSINVKEGRFSAVLDSEGVGDYFISTDATKLTNMSTGKTLNTSFQEYLYYDMMASSYYVLDDSDYELISSGLSNEWRERLIYFNVEDVSQTYDFSEKLYNAIIDHSDKECEFPDYYDRVEKIAAERAGEVYWGDTPEATKISYDQRESSQFKMFWKYIPKFRVMDRNDMLKTYAVFFMMFLFISIVCFAAVLIIGYTRCLTIAFNNNQVYDDLRHLGASPNYLYKSVKGQISKVFGVPALIGTSLIYAFYSMIMYFNDGMLTDSEIIGLGTCLIVVASMSTIIWLFYRYTLHKVCKMLCVKK